MNIKIEKNKKAPSKDEIKGRLLFGPIMIIIGALITVFASYPKYELAKESKQWTRTAGEIIETNIVIHKKGITLVETENKEFRQGEEDVLYRVDITYHYQVDTTFYRGYRKDLMQQKNEGVKTFKRAQKLESKYLNANLVAVYYNPNNPAECTLKTGLGFGQWFLITSPILLAIIGILVFINALKYSFNPPVASSYKKAKTFSDNFKS